MIEKKIQSTEEINSKEIYLVTLEGLKKISIEEALELAQRELNDLVQCSLYNDLPLCKIKNYEQEQYYRKKNKKKSVYIETKIINISPNIDDYDLARKITIIRKFLDNKCIVMIRKKYVRGITKKMNKTIDIETRCRENGIILESTKSKNMYKVTINEKK
jgi:translation initiation factor IF-3